MQRYWHQMADQLYPSLGAALEEYRIENGEKSFNRLSREIGEMMADGRFPKQAEIRSAYSNPFWKAFDRIITIEQLNESFAQASDLRGSID